MSGRVDYDVVVVGARCAGAATALLLARGGRSVLVVDRARYGSDTLSTHALTPAGVRQLSRWGVLAAVRAAGTPVVDRVVFDYGEQVAEVPVRPRGDVDGLYAPRRHLLDRILVDAAAAAGAQVRHRVAARAVWSEGGRVAGVVLDDGRTRTRVRAGLVVGADGARSLVARQVGAEVRYAAAASSATVYTYAAGLPTGAYLNYFRPGGSVGVIPTNRGEANLWVGVPMERLRRAGPAGHARVFAEVLRRVAPQLAGAVAHSGHRYASFPGRPGFVRRCFGPGWALVGDAGYFKDPASAHGMTDALIGAELLAQAVLAAAGGQAEQVALAGYARARWRLIAPMIPAVAHVASYRWDAASLQRAHREMSAAMRAEWEYLSGLDQPLGIGQTVG